MCYTKLLTILLTGIKVKVLPNVKLPLSMYKLYLNESSWSQIFRIVVKTKYFSFVLKMSAVEDGGHFHNTVL